MRVQRFLWFFLVIVLLELVACSNDSLAGVRFFSKPAITISLLIFLFSQSELPARAKKFLGLGLLFSLSGDVLLMFDESSPLFFIGGLLSFLLAHLMYLSVFLKKSMFTIKGSLVYGILLAVYATVVLYLIFPNVGDLLPFVIVYIVVLLMLVLVAFLRKPYTNNLSYRLFLFGALSFMFSDSLLALNKFYQSFEMAAVAIMLTYALAQLLIVLGGIASVKNLKP
ncbi:MAG: lysoplasmalogenase [Muricauda sp.]|nr:lysoplasmalogenase [Allomuricauda sp.]MAU27393.1 lysoplasmalogenase [Allomuricauda sp.]MBC31357.1 lysoplasmalogenase [Allomuricauda sp.]|tara:strand:+ start:14464 stop:15138 length:675 start_codon:yes stop_codon:yes gene_type:complete